MKDKTKSSLRYFIVISLVVIATFFIFRSFALQNQLRKFEQSEKQNLKAQEEYAKLRKVDSLLLHGEYQEALQAYNEMEIQIAPEDNFGIRGRIEFTKNLINLKSKIERSNALKDSILNQDSVDMSKPRRAEDINSYDSLSFALEKAKIQLNNMRNQLKEKSFGEYLRFKSLKGNWLFYVGQVKNKRANGRGVAILETGSRYEGQWKNNMRHGEGNFYWNDGERYEGNYVNDQREGQGTYYWPNGEKYVGEWKDDKRSGKGVFYNSNGEIITKGIWKDDKLEKEEK